MRYSPLRLSLLGLSLLLVLTLLMSGLALGPRPVWAAPPAQPSQRPTIDVNATFAAQTAEALASQPPVNTPIPTSSGGGGGGGGGGDTPTAPIPLGPTASPTKTRPFFTRTPTLTPSTTPDINATSQSIAATAIAKTLTALPPNATTTFITVTVMASVLAPTVVVTVVPTAASTLAVTAAPAGPVEDSRLGWLFLFLIGLVLALILFFWLGGYRLILPLVRLGKARPRAGGVKTGRELTKRKQRPY